MIDNWKTDVEGFRTYEIFCGGCPHHDVYEIEGESFKDLAAEMRKEGWEIFYSDANNAWTHLCPVCKEKKKAEEINNDFSEVKEKESFLS